jgi:hypothetical protein
VVFHGEKSVLIFRKQDVSEKPNLQKSGTEAKPYQVKQIGNLIIKYKLGDNV